MRYPAVSFHRVLVHASLLLLLSCGQRTLPVPQAPDTRAANEAAVRATVEDFRNTIRRHDVEQILSFYATDGWQMTQSGQIARTDAERRVFWQNIVSMPVAFEIVDVTGRIEVAKSGDVAVHIGEYRQLFVRKPGDVTSLPQRFMTSWRKQPDGSWKVSASMATLAN